MDAIRKSNVKPDLPLAALELFEVAGRAQNLTRAAEIAGLSQPAFSHRIRDLERTLGVTLFHREHRGVTLTRAGEDLLAVCTRSLGDLRAALERIRAGPGSKVLVATDFGFSSYWIMETGSVTAAGQSLNVTQPSISKHLKHLEAALGVSLFERTGNKLISTAEARAFYDQIERTYLGLDHLSRFARDLSNNRHGEILLAAMPLIAHSWLPDIVAGFLRDHETISMPVSTTI